MSAGASITVDVDAEAGLPEGRRDFGHRLTARSERTYGITRGLPRILGVLAEHAVQATFYVPGVTAERHPDAVAAILAHGHELGHHGHRHLRTDTLDPAGERAELVDGLHALTAVSRRRPSCYRSPGWELTPETLRLLPELGFRADSSLMGDDRPYALAVGTPPLLELPVHWALDDAPHFDATADPAALLDVWRAELRHAVVEARHVTYTLHPEILGRAHRLDVLRTLLEDLAAAGVPTITHGAVVEAWCAPGG